MTLLIVCVTLVLLQQSQGTTLAFSAGTAIFTVLAALAFNVAGGFTRPSGGFIFAYSCIGVLFGIVFKIFVGEPGQSNLLVPNLTLGIYCASMAGLLLAVYLARRLRTKKSYLPQFRSPEEMYRGSVGLMIAGVAILGSEYLRTSAAASGSAISVLYRLDVFLPLSILLGVAYETERSGGRRSVNGPVLVTMAIMFANGVIGYSKEGMITPFVCWLIPAATHRYRISLAQIAGFVVGFAFLAYYLVPYSQYGRDFKASGATVSANFHTNFVLLSNLPLVRKVYLQQQAELFTGDNIAHYYNKPQGLADRVQMVSMDDAAVNLTEEGAVFGTFPTIFSFENLVPHFIWPGKPTLGFGNMYAHELGFLGDEEDTTTGVSFSPSGDAYHQAKWMGVLLLLPLLSLMLFTIADSFCGDTRKSPFALLLLLIYAHAAPEGGITQFSPLAFATTAQLFLAAFLAARVMPIIASLILGPAKETTGWTAPAWQSLEKNHVTVEPVAE